MAFPVFNLRGQRAHLPGLFSEEDEERESQAMALEEIAGCKADMYGTAYIPSMSEQSLREGLYQLDSEVERIPYNEKRCFLEALEKCPDQVDDKHRIAFLWRERFDARLAARRLVDHWEHKHAVFGEDKCFLPLTLRGALKDDIPVLSSGIFQLLPVKDTSGRAILFFDPSRRDTSKHPRDSVLRALWYILCTAVEDPETQKQGCVFLAFVKHSKPHQFDIVLYPMIMELENSYLPILYRSFHICHPDPFFRAVSPIAKFILGKRLRTRLGIHFGTEQAVLEKLIKYGIPPEQVPTDMGGYLALDQTKWLCDRLSLEKRQEQNTPNQSLDTSRMAEDMLQLYEQKLGGAERSVKRRRESASHAGDTSATLPGSISSQHSPLAQGLNGLRSVTAAGNSAAVGSNNTIYHSLLHGVLRSLPNRVNGMGHNPTNAGTATGLSPPFNLGSMGSVTGAPSNSSVISQLQLAQAGMTGGAKDPASTLRALQSLNGGSGVSGTGTFNPYLAAQCVDAMALQQVQRALREFSLQGADRADSINQLSCTGINGPASTSLNSGQGPASFVAAVPQQQPSTAAGLLGDIRLLCERSSQSPSPSTPAAMAHPFYLPRILSLHLDEEKISAHQCLIRKQIEAFTATKEHVSNHARGRNKPIFMGQVGIRCRHCKGLPLTSSQKGSLYFPSTLVGLYQAAQNMAGFHITNPATSCKNMPQEVKDEFQQVQSCKSTVGGGKIYWAEAAKMIGLVDTPYGIRFVG